MNRIEKLTRLAMILLLCGVFLLSLSFRVIKLQQGAGLAGDEGIQLLTASHLLNYKIFPISGEISSLNKENTLLIHNSPLGLYFLTFLYWLGSENIFRYLFIHILLNMGVIILLSLTAKNIFSKKAALITFLLASFAPFIFRMALWTSQPTNAVIWEVIALFFFSLFIKYRQQNYLLASILLSLLATQMYPPMYLLLPIKIFFLFKIFKKKTFNQTFYIKLLIGAFLIYLPLIYLELKTNFINGQALIELLKQKFQTNRHEFIIVKGNFFSNLYFVAIEATAHSLGEPIKKHLFIFFSATFIWFIYLIRKDVSTKRNLLRLSVFLAFPLFFVAVYHTLQPGLIGRTYLVTLTPYFILFFALLLAQVEKKYLLIILPLMLILSLSSIIELIHIQKKPNFVAIDQSVNYIIEKSENSFSNKNLHVISKEDIWNWDNTMYWYLIEQKTKKQLVTFDLPTSKTKRIAPVSPEIVFLLCHGLNKGFSEESCLDTFFNKVQEGLSNNQYYLSEKKQFEGISVFILKEDLATTTSLAD